MPARLLLTAVAVAVIVLAGAAAVDAGIHEVGQKETFDESFVPDAGNVTELNHSNLDSVRYYYESNVTVRNGSGVVMAPGADYEWFRSNGTVLTVTGGRLDGDASADITYGYRVTSDEVQNVSSVGASGFQAGALLVLVLVVSFVVVGMRAMGAV